MEESREEVNGSRHKLQELEEQVRNAKRLLRQQPGIVNTRLVAQTVFANLLAHINTLYQKVDLVETQRDGLALDALSALSGAGVSTPVEGFVAAPYTLKRAIGDLAKERDSLGKALQEVIDWLRTNELSRYPGPSTMADGLERTLHATNFRPDRDDVCMCGDPIDKHTGYEGHTPVSMREYYEGKEGT